MKATTIALLLPLIAALGCAGRTPDPVPAYQLGDDRKSCYALKAELANNDAEIQRKIPDADKTGRNIALGVAGAFFLVPWFFMDLSKADQVELESLRRRHNNLLILAAEKSCGVDGQPIPEFQKPPAQTAAAAPAAVQVPSSTAPVDASLDPRMPRPGDMWKYQRIDGWNDARREVFVHQVVASNPIEIGERMYVAGRTAIADEQVFTLAGVRMFERELQRDLVRVEFAPYLQAFRGDLTFGGLGTVGSSGAGNETWQYSARVVGREVVRVPAGTFEAVKIEIKGARASTQGNITRAATHVSHIVWYAPKAKRYVRYEINSSQGNTQMDRERFELIEYSLR